MMAKRKKKSHPTLTLTSLHLPFDLVGEILCRLPVNHLIKLCCVSKSWNSLISEDSEFAKKHHRLSISNHDRHHLIRIPTHSLKEFVLSHSPLSSIFSPVSTTSVKQFNYSVDEIPSWATPGTQASTCDGMVCFKVNESFAVLCNPSIRKFEILPPLEFPDLLCIFYTLVYDRFINKYKIIALNPFSKKKEVHIHTLGTDYWRRIKDFPGPDLDPGPRTGIFVNDYVNWLAYADGFTIVSFDLKKETYQKLAPPVFDDSTSLFTLGTLKGCLSLLFYDTDSMISDIWIKKEYGNEKSWNKLFTVPYMRECGFYNYTRVLYISEDDKVLMEFGTRKKSNLGVYDSIKNTFKILKFLNKDNIHSVMIPEIYIESLISPL